jgi:hypothetical protein
LSLATPLVAGIAAYLRSLDSKWKVDLQDPRLLKALIKRLERRLQVDPYEFPSPMPLPPGRGDIKVKTAWNGQVYDKSCLLHTQSAGGDGFPGDFLCPDINEIYQPDADRRAFGPAQGSGGAAIQYQPGPAGPLCTNAPKLARRADTDTCGKLCTGFYCEPNPTGHPPTDVPGRDRVRAVAAEADGDEQPTGLQRRRVPGPAEAGPRQRVPLRARLLRRQLAALLRHGYVQGVQLHRRRLRGRGAGVLRLRVVQVGPARVD